jgi:hypothetical protein
MDKIERLEKAISDISGIMIAYSTDGRTENQPKEYQELFIDLDVMIEEAGYNNPNPYKTIELFWKDCGSTWAQRRELVGMIYADLLFDIGRKKRKQKNPKNWEKANKVLKDELFPVQSQWMKAKNFLIMTPPDYENSIKESINSIESCLMILLKQPKGTLGKLIKNPNIDPDISKIISSAYGFISNKDFVRHGGVVNQNLGKLEAEFFLEFSGCAILYIKEKLRKP